MPAGKSVNNEPLFHFRMRSGYKPAARALTVIADTQMHLMSDSEAATARMDADRVPDMDLNDASLYVNRELALLAFQERVLEEARDENNPLLERLKFMAIVGSNLDEFFMVRVGGLMRQVAGGVTDSSPDGRTPAEQLAAVRDAAHDLMGEAVDYLRTTLVPALAVRGIHILDYKDLSDRARGNVNARFEELIFPILTPLAFDPGHPFPYISSRSLNLAVLVRDEQGQERFARVKVPSTIPRLFPVKKSSGSVRKDGTVPYKHTFVWLEQLMAARLELLFPGIKVVEAHPFRITRNADMSIQEMEAYDLLASMEEGIRQRRFGAVVRMEVTKEMPTRILAILMQNLEVSGNNLYVIDGPLGIDGLMPVSRSIERADLRDRPFVPFTPALLKEAARENGMFAALGSQQFLLHHPYDSFSPVVEFLEEASVDPDVLAIKMTLYRVGSNSPIVDALLKARQNGKQVAVLVELKARFDEESNIGWARMLEQEGVHVTYGLLGLKTHSKISLVVRKEGRHIRRYLHLATGNYNVVTAHLYEDLGYFTTDPDLGADATDLFNFLTGYSDKREFRKLLVAPNLLRSRLEALVRREIAYGKDGHLMLKTNSLVDRSMVKLLYKASMAGVRVDLFVRGICCLRPGLMGISENITVTSILGRFLEHSRIYYFRNDGNEDVYMGSADLMPRNLDRRVEILFPMENDEHIRYLRDTVMDTCARDNLKAWRMRPDGTYKRVKMEGSEERISVQDSLLRMRERSAEAEKEQAWGIF